MKKSNIYSQGLQIKRLCSDCHKLQKDLENLKNCFSERGYPGGLIGEQLMRVKRKSREELLRPKSVENKSVLVPFVVTYLPHLKNINKVIKKHIKHLYADPEVKSVFTPLPFAFFRSVWNLRSHLVRSKLYHQEWKIGSSKCNSPCCLNCNNIKECDTFISHITKETFKINHHFNCKSKSLNYLFNCKVCGKQYVRSTTGKFRYQWNNYSRKQKEEKILCKNNYMIIF